MVVITISTIGYHEAKPLSDAGKLFNVAHILLFQFYRELNFITEFDKIKNRIKHQKEGEKILKQLYR